MKPLEHCRLYAFVDNAYLRDRPPAEVLRQLADGGADVVQLRAKQASPDDIRRLAEALLPVAQSAGVWFVVNDHPEIAAEIGAPLCHLGQEDFFDAGHTHISQLSTLNPQLRIGLSTHSPSQARRALAAGADYLAVGPVFATGTKPGATPVTLDYVRWAAAGVSIPWFAIGGINLQNLDAVLTAGARRVAVVSAILNAPDIAKACREFKTRLISAPPPPPGTA